MNLLGSRLCWWIQLFLWIFAFVYFASLQNTEVLLLENVHESLRVRHCVLVTKDGKSDHCAHCTDCDVNSANPGNCGVVPASHILSLHNAIEFHRHSGHMHIREYQSGIGREHVLNHPGKHERKRQNKFIQHQRSKRIKRFFLLSEPFLLILKRFVKNSF